MDALPSIDEINTRFVSEWILLEDPQTDEALRVLGGKVAAHSRDRDEVYRFAAETCPKRFAILYTGEPALTVL
jgi:hypothetical protein